MNTTEDGKPLGLGSTEGLGGTAPKRADGLAAMIAELERQQFDTRDASTSRRAAACATSAGRQRDAQRKSQRRRYGVRWTAGFGGW